ncbi:MAG: NACHT domain-containing protein, partial [Archangium sp.]
AGLVVASRPLGGAAPVPRRPHLKVRLEKWDEASLNRHLGRWSEHRPGLVARLKQDVQADLPRPLLQNPLTATFCLSLAQEEPAALKRGRAGIFESMVRLLCEQWVGGRSAEEGSGGVPWHEVAPFLRQLALAALQKQEQQVTREDLLRLLARIAPDLKERLLGLMQGRFGLLVRQEDGSYRFVLRGVAEHLAGAELRRLGAGAIVEAAREKWAEEPVRHAIGLIAELDSLPQALAVIDQLLVPQDKRDGLRFFRSQLTAVRTATDLPVQDGPTVDRLTRTLAGMLAHESSSWMPRRAEQVLDEWSLAHEALRRAVGARLLALLRIPGKRSSWVAAREKDSAEFWLRVLEERDPEVRLVALQRLARWVDVNAVRNALLDSLRDWEEPYPRYPPAILAGQVLRGASRDAYFKATLPELLELLRRQHSRSALGAALALRPGEAPAEELAERLHTLEQNYGCPPEVVSELASREDGRRALEEVWPDWQGPMKPLPPPPMPSDESAREPVPPPSSFIKERLIHLLGPELSQLEPAEREQLVPLNSFAVAPAFLRAASDYPEGVLWLLAHFREVFFQWEEQRRLGEAAVRHPSIQQALLKQCAGMEDSDAYEFPGVALDVLVAAGNEEAVVHLATWLRTDSLLRLLREPLSREALLHPRVREAAVERMESEWTQATVPNEEGGVRPMPHAAAVFRALRPALEGTELEERWVRLARDWTAHLAKREESSSVDQQIHDKDYAIALIVSFWNPPHPPEVQDALAAYVAVLSRGDEEFQSGIVGGVHWAEEAGCLELMRPTLETCSMWESWLRYACSASLVSLLGRNEATALSGKLASEWPDFWSPDFNAPVELEQLIAANPGAWNRRVHELGAEHLRAITLQGYPIGHVARALLLHLPRADQLGLARLLFSSMKHSHHPWLNPGSHLPANAYRPGEAVLELLFDLGLSPD